MPSVLMSKNASIAISRSVIVVVGCVFAVPLLAHQPAPVHQCEAPVRPVDDQDDVAWQSYLTAVDEFRGCIDHYSQANRAASRAHTDAANSATQDWNVYVKEHLNVPEDFPWPSTP